MQCLHHCVEALSIQTCHAHYRELQSSTSATVLVGTAPTLPLSRMSPAPGGAHCHPESWPWASRPMGWKSMGTLSTLRVMPHSHVYECACASDQKRLHQRSARALGPLGSAAVLLQVVRVTVSAWSLWSGRRRRMVGGGPWLVGLKTRLAGGLRLTSAPMVA